MSISVFLLALGSIARITRFVTADTLAAPLRATLIRRFGPESKPATLATCTWCLSVWAAAAIMPIAYFFGRTAWFVIAAAVLTASHLTGTAATWLERD